MDTISYSNLVSGNILLFKARKHSGDLTNLNKDLDFFVCEKDRLFRCTVTTIIIHAVNILIYNVVKSFWKNVTQFIKVNMSMSKLSLRLCWSSVCLPFRTGCFCCMTHLDKFLKVISYLWLIKIPSLFYQGTSNWGLHVTFVSLALLSSELCFSIAQSIKLCFLLQTPKVYSMVFVVPKGWSNPEMPAPGLEESSTEQGTRHIVLAFSPLGLKLDTLV